MDIILLVITRKNRVEKLMILPLCILPFNSDTTSHITARLMKKVACEGIYDLKLEGLVHTTAIKDIARMTISAKRVITRNLRFSIRLRLYNL